MVSRTRSSKLSARILSWDRVAFSAAYQQTALPAVVATVSIRRPDPVAQLSGVGPNCGPYAMSQHLPSRRSNPLRHPARF